MSKIKESSTQQENKFILGSECSDIYSVNLISGQWTLAICCHLMQGKLRFGQLKKLLPTISERMLTLQLRKMEENKLLIRKVYAEVPARVEYELTATAKLLKPILKQLEDWGEQHRLLK